MSGDASPDAAAAESADFAIAGSQFGAELASFTDSAPGDDFVLPGPDGDGDLPGQDGEGDLPAPGDSFDLPAPDDGFDLPAPGDRLDPAATDGREAPEHPAVTDTDDFAIPPGGTS